MKWRGYCDSYAEPAPNSKDDTGSSQGGQLIHTKAAPLILEEPNVNTLRFTNSDQRAYFDEWTSLSIGFLSGGLIRAKLWAATMPQVSLDERPLRYGAMAVGALRKALATSNRPHGALEPDNRHYMNALNYYCEAMRLQSTAVPTNDTLRTALLSSLLFICFESLRGNLPVALKHMVHGFSMLNELANCTTVAPGLVRIAAAPPAMVQEILDCYKPLELQSRSFMGSYQKFFYTQNKPGVNGGPAQAIPSPPISYVRTPPSQASSPPGGPNTPQYTGLPSPDSQASPMSQAGGSSPNSSNPPTSPPSRPGGPPPGGMPPRPPHIQPFSKHSPYFRPRLTHVTDIDEMPVIFASFEESAAYWSLVQKQMVKSLPLLTMTTAKLRLPHARSEAEVEMKLNSIRQNEQLSAFVADSRFWIQRWFAAYEPLYLDAVRNAENNRQLYLEAINVRMEYLILYIYTTMPRYAGLITARGLTPQYREMAQHAETLMASQQTCGFAMDAGWTWPLFISAFSCRDPSVRAYAIDVLGKYPMRNALRDSRVFRALAVKNQELERTIAKEGDENTQWLRLRRREVLFDDFGASVVFRSPVKNETTGEWELIEEAATFDLNEDGSLTWQQREISDANSILGGVC